MLSLKQIKDEIEKWDKFILMGHLDPDGDCIGSLFALKWYLASCNKSSIVLLADPPEEKYEILTIEESDYQLFADYSLKKKDDLCCIALDSGDLDRLGDGLELARELNLINIDHHIDNPNYGEFNYVNPEKAAVGEIIYDLIKLDPDYLMNKKIGNALATAIIADTGSFRYQNTSADIFKIMAELIKIGVDVYTINKAIFSNYQYSAIKLRGKALSSMNLVDNGKVAYLKIDQRMLDEAGADLKDSSGLVNYARDISGVEVGLVFTELDEDKTRVNFRSNNYCPVHEIAGFFGGGGHPRAAGCTIDEGIDQVENIVLQKVKEYV